MVIPNQETPLPFKENDLRRICEVSLTQERSALVNLITRVFTVNTSPSSALLKCRTSILTLKKKKQEKEKNHVTMMICRALTYN